MKYLLNLFFLGVMLITLGCSYTRKQMSNVLDEVASLWPEFTESDCKKKLSFPPEMNSDDNLNRLDKKLNKLEKKVTQLEKKIKKINANIKSKNKKKKNKNKKLTKTIQGHAKKKRVSQKKSYKPSSPAKSFFNGIPRGKDVPTAGYVYRVYMGAFSYKNNATKRVASILALQVPAIVISDKDKIAKDVPQQNQNQAWKPNKNEYADYKFLLHHAKDMQAPPSPKKREALYFVVSKQFYSYAQGRHIVQQLTRKGYESYLKKML